MGLVLVLVLVGPTSELAGIELVEGRVEKEARAEPMPVNCTSNRYDRRNITNLNHVANHLIGRSADGMVQTPMLAFIPDRLKI